MCDCKTYHDHMSTDHKYEWSKPFIIYSLDPSVTKKGLYNLNDAFTVYFFDPPKNCYSSMAKVRKVKGAPWTILGKPFVKIINGVTIPMTLDALEIEIV
jgi:hypothetical protein